MKWILKLFFYVSWATLLGLILRFIPGCSFLHGAEWFEGIVFPILLSAAVGYLTNYIAIEMLFKPYFRRAQSPFSLAFWREGDWLRYASFGFWKQGMVPANKGKIGKTLGEVIPRQLLDPTKLSEDLCKMASSLFSQDDLVVQVKPIVHKMLDKYRDNIGQFLIPHIEKGMTLALEEKLTPANLRLFWDRVASGWLENSGNRSLIAKSIANNLREQSPQLRSLLQNELKVAVRSYVESKIPFPKIGEIVAQGVDFFDWSYVENRMKNRLADEETQKIITEKLLEVSLSLRDWLYSKEAEPKIQDLLIDLRAGLYDFLKDYLNENLMDLADRILQSEALWDWFGSDLLPQLQRYLNYWLSHQGKILIIEKLNLQERIEKAVDGQDIPSFHQMINGIVEENLGMIQILGFVLGAFVGTLQVLGMSFQ